MNYKDLLILLIVPIAMLIAASYMMHITDNIVRKSAELKSIIPDVDGLKVRIEKEGKDSVQGNLNSYLGDFRELLVRMEDNNIEFYQLIKEHFKFHLILAACWLAFVFTTFYSSRRRNKILNEASDNKE